MTDEDLYDGFSPERQTDYEAWLIERHGDDMPARIEAARRAIVETPDGKLGLAPEIMADLESLEGALVAAFEAGTHPGAEALAPHLEEHRDWVAQRWGRPCDARAYQGLADLYLAHPDFVARYEALAAGFSAFLTDAMTAHANKDGSLT